MKLTDVALQKLRPNSRNDFIVQGRTGLIVRAAPTNGGTKVQFRYRWKKEGKTSVVTLGEYPDLSIKDANALHGLCAQASGQPYGEPKAVVEEWHRKRAPAVFEPGAGPTIKQAVTKWLTDYAEKARKRPEDVRRLLESNVCTKPIGAIPVASATRAHFNDAFMEIVERGAPVTSTRVRDALKQVFTFCADIEFTDRIPPMPKGKPGGKEKPRDRVLSDTEIRILWHGLDILSPVGQAADPRETLRDRSETTLTDRGAPRRVVRRKVVGCPSGEVANPQRGRRNGGDTRSDVDDHRE